MIELIPEILTRERFAPFGTVIERVGHSDHFPINNGSTERFHAMAELDVAEQGGIGILSIFHASRRVFPYVIDLVERHPLGSQAFIPLDQASPWFVVVAEGRSPEPETCRAFIARGTQGVQYAKGVWHHPLISLQDESDFLVADRSGDGENLEEKLFENTQAVITEEGLDRALKRLKDPAA